MREHSGRYPLSVLCRAGCAVACHAVPVLACRCAYARLFPLIPPISPISLIAPMQLLNCPRLIDSSATL